MRLNKLILILCLLALSMGALAQTRIARELHLGVIGGACMSNYRLTPTVTQDLAKGYTFGLAARYIEEKIFGIQAELLLTRRGEKDKFDEYPELSFQRNFTYFEVPILAHLYFDCGKKNEINFDIGPKFGYFLSDKAKAQLEGENWDKVQNMTYHKYQHHTMPVSKKFDYGLQMGLGYEFKVNKELSIQLQGRYYFGLGNIFPDSKADVYETSNNHQIQIVAAVWFRSQVAKYKILKKQRYYSKKK